ncbi:pseudouridine synthase, RluA family [Thioalkalivibrio sp. K90mix]|uniref:23S rRNA pseudouridine(1911/1915/1917) synthase RluD n=1 Tax=unclassified Thioalkalivibrio TaxID=2621013 RepID=UPI00019598CA|nr:MULTISPECIES: 23S rRNA pseudouridine(1911/1915/1917) synthase RluD [unclassified Thioalkalivibrio]ADC72525.1 pseudouridine synthase, RluA family [Thioalkalivibrio sp. K90mix]
MNEPRSAELPEEEAGQRLDAALARLFPEYSRSQLTQWLKEGALTVNGGQPKPRTPVQGGEHVVLEPPEAPVLEAEPEPIALDIVHEDPAVLVINKPAGLVVHPAAGHRAGTLVNALLHHDPNLSQLPRAGVVHRLDKDTTGLMVVARTPQAQTALVRQLQQRTVHREYRALVQGRVISGATIEEPIGRHPVDRKRQAVTGGGKPAVTHYRVAERFPAHTLLNVRLETGRTHQIRVHMAHIRHPIVGDPAYGGRPRPVRGMGEAAKAALAAFRRQALHAARLEFEHPDSGEVLAFEAPVPEDFEALLAALRTDREADHDR